MDRTNWKFGKTDINFLVLGIAHRGIAVPIFWTVLGNSNTAEQIAIMERFISVFGVGKIAVLLADREFIGAECFHWLQRQKYHFINELSATPSLVIHGIK